MKCVNCSGFSIGIICKNCAKILQDTRIYKRNLENLEVYHFYNYSEIKNLILSKHNLYGYFVYKKLAEFSFKKFAKEFEYDEPYCPVAIDDNIRSAYSHTAILSHSMRSKFAKPAFNVLRATNLVNYSGKSLEFRLKNRRNFTLNNRPKHPVVLIDDVVTTGLTLTEAKEFLEKNGISVLFALVLANAKE